MRRLLPLLVLPLAACDPCAAACAALADTPPVVRLLAGDAEVVEVEDGAEVRFVEGPQGGFHLFGGARVEGLLGAGEHGTVSDPCNPTVDFAVEGEVGDLWSPVRRPLFPAGDGVWETTGELVILDVVTAAAADGRAVTLSVEVQDACGRSARDARAVTLRHGG